MFDEDLIADAIAAENVRLLLEGKLAGLPLPGTLACRVRTAKEDAFMNGLKLGSES